MLLFSIVGEAELRIKVSTKSYLLVQDNGCADEGVGRRSDDDVEKRQHWTSRNQRTVLIMRSKVSFVLRSKGREGHRRYILRLSWFWTAGYCRRCIHFYIRTLNCSKIRSVLVGSSRLSLWSKRHRLSDVGVCVSLYDSSAKCVCVGQINNHGFLNSLVHSVN